jgi:opacity protein-like surface antigen
MVSVKVASFAAVAALFATAAHAADMPSLPPVYAPPIEESASGWYLRGDIGMTNQQFKNLHQRRDDIAGQTVTPIGQGWDSATLFDIGFGYKFNDWFRADLIGQYRGKANFHGSDNVTFSGGAGADNYSGSKSEWVFMANAYADLGTWWCITPYVGAGIGAANIKISGFRDDSVTNTGGGASPGTYFAQDASQWNFAWALHAGLTYQVTRSMSIDLGYSYMDLGNATTGSGQSFDGTNANGGPFTFHHITSHDLKLGVRWLLEPPAQTQPIMLPPLMRRG